MKKDQLNKNIEQYKKLLMDMRSQIISQFETEKLKSLDMPKVTVGDEIDLASEDRFQEFSQLMGKRDKIKLDKIQAALEKIESGDFGICDECGEKISEKRLTAIPYTALCVDCQEKEEIFAKESNNKLTYSNISFSREDEAS